MSKPKVLGFKKAIDLMHRGAIALSATKSGCLL